MNRLAMCDSQYRAAELVRALREADPQEANDLLREWFNSCDAIGEHAPELARHFDRAGFVTDTDERLELPVTVYRAGWEDDDPGKGLSWTTDVAVAQKFARALFSPRAKFVLGIYRPGVAAVVWSATCTKARAYLNSRHEFEVVPKRLEGVCWLHRFEERATSR